MTGAKALSDFYIKNEKRFDEFARAAAMHCELFEVVSRVGCGMVQ